LGSERPSLVVVQGDTGSALGGALAANFSGIPVAHVEAGLRSHDLRRPWPEEEFRVAIDRDSELLFAPTELSAANLRRERITGQIHVTGNSGIDAVIGFRESGCAGKPDAPPRLLVTCHRRENWGDGLCGVAAALTQVSNEAIARIDVLLHPNPALSATVRQLLLPARKIRFREACGHSATIAAMRESSLVLSDSGGMQEEAATLGVPLLVLRDKTERPEAIASGNIELVGTDPERIVKAVRRRLARSSPVPSLPFGDGRAGQRIAAIIAGWLAHKDRISEPGDFREPAMRANA
jgi:UDP-N-acetylglucosamine 2-epimerase (non-hydrolysing)